MTEEIFNFQFPFFNDKNSILIENWKLIIEHFFTMEGHNKELGAWGEEYAVRFLIGEGYNIAKRNYRVRTAEIDIVAWHNVHGEKTLCFIEVKTRTGHDGSAERATNTKGKLQKIQLAAHSYLKHQGIDIGTVPVQFEHISVYLYDGLPRCSLYIIPV